MTPTRPVLRYHGGKWNLAPWILSHLPPHRVYVEPFGGAASVLMRKKRSYAEVYNDLDGDMVNLFRVLQNAGQAERLIHLLTITPFARDEFELSYERTDEPVERARRLCIRSVMGFGSNGHNIATKTGFRANSNRSGTTPARDWVTYPKTLRTVVERFQGVVIDNRHAVDVMRQHDGPETVHYVDPPYHFDTRSQACHRAGMYSHEMDDADHATLLGELGTLDGMVVLSGYPHDSYDAALKGWHRVACDALADGARDRTEVLWINPQAWERNHGGLFLDSTLDSKTPETDGFGLHPTPSDGSASGENGDNTAPTNTVSFVGIERRDTSTDDAKGSGAQDLAAKTGVNGGGLDSNPERFFGNHTSPVTFSRHPASFVPPSPATPAAGRGE
jgi:DNA adenine methylase